METDNDNNNDNNENENNCENVYAQRTWRLMIIMIRIIIIVNIFNEHCSCSKEMELGLETEGRNKLVSDFVTATFQVLCHCHYQRASSSVLKIKIVRILSLVVDQ